MKTLIILFDSLLNTVFYHQVFQPIKNQALTDPQSFFVILSFEKKLSQAALFLEKNLRNTSPPNLKFILKERSFFWGTGSLFFLKKSLTSLLKDNDFNLIQCRGIFAAKILQLSLNDFHDKNFFGQTLSKAKAPKINKVVISLPGIAEEEVLLIDQNNFSFFSFLKSKLQNWLIKKTNNSFFKNLIKMKKQVDPGDIKFLTYTNALQDYFSKNYNLKSEFFLKVPKLKIFVDEKEKQQSRNKIRKLLKIDDDTKIYCYLGGLQSWQNFELSAEYFSNTIKRFPKSHFLVICREEAKANKILDKYLIPKKKRTVISLPSEKIQEYLFACDFGLLLREKNLVNWTSRPIKAIEYLSAGLKIIHNNSIEWVIQNSK